MSKTNFDKLVRWDADYYKELTDDDCLICLTEREVYLVGQIIEMLKWRRTRWIGDIVGLDFDLIASNLEYKLAERMTCQNVSTLLQKITQLEAKIDYVFNETVVNEGDTPFDPETTVTDDVFTPSEMQTGDMAVESDECDIDGKSAIYGAVSQVIRYITQNNTDFLEQLEQNIGNLAEQTQTVLSAFPPTDLMALDEIAKWTQFIVSELLEEYNATVTEELIQETICDIFCIAVANNCRLTMWDIYNYFSSKLPAANFSNAVTTFADLVQFALIGSFSGNDYFYYMCYFQLLSAAFGGAVTGDGLKNYELQIAAGFNSPDSDWTLFCDECPIMYRSKTWNFAAGEQGWTLATIGAASTKGEFIGNRWRGTVTQFGQRNIELNFVSNPAWRIHAARMYMRIEDAVTSSNETASIRLRPTVNSNTGLITLTATTGISNGDYLECADGMAAGGYHTGINQFYVSATCDDSEGSNVYIDKIEFLFQMNYAPEDAIITTDLDICD